MAIKSHNGCDCPIRIVASCANGRFEDFDILHTFSGKVGDIVDRTIDQPFYEDMDAFVQSMRDVSISNYTTTNRIGATEIVQSYAGYGVPQQFEIDKAEVSLDDLLSGDTFYGEQMKLEYEAWKELNPDQDFAQKEYQHAFSIQGFSSMHRFGTHKKTRNSGFKSET
jgi:hypothetical protein